MNRLEFIADKSGVSADVKQMYSDMMNQHGRLHVIVRPVRETRSTEQNKLFSLFCRRLAKQAGTSFEDMKATVKEYAMEMGYPAAVDDDGVMMTGSDGEILPMPSHKADTTEFGILLDACHELAYEYGFVLE